MRCVQSVDTKPELLVRSLLHRLGFRFRIHDHRLPGTPDIVLQKYHTVIFVHGCFWHRHKNCKRASTPSSRTDYWLPKFERSVLRDRVNQRQLRRIGWKVIIVWECQTKNIDQLAKRLFGLIVN
jgi:DNA mismatch endonuclease, patch repair protein